MTYQTGQKLGNYQLERFLGYGGFAEVYLGKHIYLNTQAAIKVLQRQLSAEALEKFLQEARIIAGLKHPHIVGVLEFGIEEQRPFLVMAYAPHGTLRSRYNRGKTLSPTTILSPIKQIADALQYAHERKIIHRDVKPDNMLLDENDTVLLSDFGLALRERGTYQSERSTDSAGTTMYMAPEQLRGKPCLASDQYALGVVMYEWLCGCLPFDGPDISIVVQHLHEQPVPLRKHVPMLSTEVEAVVLRALEKDPKQRFASVKEMAIAFEAACKDMLVAENIVSMPGIDISKDEGVLFSTEVMEAQQESLSSEVVKELLDSGENSVMPGAAQPSYYTSLQAPSLSASLDLSTSRKDTVDLSTPVQTIIASVDGSTISSQNRPRISRRAMIGGIAGIGVALGGMGIWRFNSHGVGTLSLDVQAIQKGLEPSTAVATPTGRGSANSGTGGKPGTNGVSTSSPIGGNSATKNGVTQPGTGSKSGSTGTSTSSNNTTSPSNNGIGNSGNNNNSNSGSGIPVATSTPDNSGSTFGVTPVATASTSGGSPAAPLTVQIINPPSSVTTGTMTNISVMTNTSNISFQFEADYSGFRSFFRQPSPDIIPGTTDGNGNATVSWTPSLPPGQILFGTSADLHITATDQNGNSVTSQDVQVQITRF